VHEMGGPTISSEADFTSLLALSSGEAGPEVIGYWAELGAVELARELGADGAGGDLFCDGSLGSHTAALHSPYTDQPGDTGTLYHSTTDLAEHLLRCDRVGLPAGFHAIGEAAVDQVLDAAEMAARQLGRPIGQGHRIEHAEMVNDSRRLAASGFSASMQPAFDANWGGSEGMYAERLGTDRARRLNPIAELAAAGVALAFGSDAPVTPLAPWAGVRAAMHPRAATTGLSVAAAFAAHTVGGWRAAGRAGEGILTVGAPATFAVWSAGELVDGLPMLTGGLEGPLPQCLRTVVRGQAVFDRLG
jgi:predicted amidohydrolase YtcJ